MCWAVYEEFIWSSHLLSSNLLIFTHGSQRWNHGSSDGLFVLLIFLLLLLFCPHTTFQILTFELIKPLISPQNCWDLNPRL